MEHLAQKWAAAVPHLPPASRRRGGGSPGAETRALAPCLQLYPFEAPSARAAGRGTTRTTRSDGHLRRVWRPAAFRVRYGWVPAEEAARAPYLPPPPPPCAAIAPTREPKPIREPIRVAPKTSPAQARRRGDARRARLLLRRARARGGFAGRLRRRARGAERGGGECGAASPFVGGRAGGFAGAARRASISARTSPGRRSSSARRRDRRGAGTSAASRREPRHRGASTRRAASTGTSPSAGSATAISATCAARWASTGNPGSRRGTTAKAALPRGSNRRSKGWRRREPRRPGPGE